MARGWKRERLGAIGFCDGPALRRTTLEVDTPVSPLVGLQAGGFSVFRSLSVYLPIYLSQLLCQLSRTSRSQSISCSLRHLKGSNGVAGLP
jgi:hypothetical protein